MRLGLGTIDVGATAVLGDRGGGGGWLAEMVLVVMQRGRRDREIRVDARSGGTRLERERPEVVVAQGALEVLEKVDEVRVGVELVLVALEGEELVNLRAKHVHLVGVDAIVGVDGAIRITDVGNVAKEQCYKQVMTCVYERTTRVSKRERERERARESASVYDIPT